MPRNFLFFLCISTTLGPLLFQKKVLDFPSPETSARRREKRQQFGGCGVFPSKTFCMQGFSYGEWLVVLLLAASTSSLRRASSASAPAPSASSEGPRRVAETKNKTKHLNCVLQLKVRFHLQCSVQVDLDPAWRLLDALPVVVGAPPLDEAEAQDA